MNRSAKTPTITTGRHSQNKTRTPSSPDVDYDIRPGRKRNASPPKVKLKLKGNIKSSNSGNSNDASNLRRSPRRQKNNIQVQKPISTTTSCPQQKSKTEPLLVTPASTSSSFTTTSYRIPKKSNNNNIVQNKASSAIQSTSGQLKNQNLDIKTTPPTFKSDRNSSLGLTNIISGHKSSTSTPSAERKEKTMAPSNNKQQGDSTPSQPKNRPAILQAKRRLVGVQPSPVNNNNKMALNITSTPSLLALNKTFEDLPDYEDSVVEDQEEGEDVKLNNPMYKILKMVKDRSMIVTQPQDPIAQEVTAMDVDIMELPAPLPSNEKIIIVPDTNIWINDLHLIETLMNKEFGKPVLVIIPWMVLQELDVGVHQKAKHGPSLFMKMKKPIQYIHTLLARKHPRIQGQKAYEAAISSLKFDELVADDSILNCVFQNLKCSNAVIFLTNDTNLLNKALVNGIIATNGSSALQTLNEVLSGNINNTHKAGEDLTLLSNPSNSNNNNLHNVKRRFDSSDSGCGNNDYIFLDNNNDDIEMQEEPLCKVRAIVGQQFSSTNKSSTENEFQMLETALLKAFSYIIQRKMIEDYGMGGWEYALKIKKPWTLASAIKCMSVHWIANFSFVFTNRAQKHLDKLIELYSRANHGKNVQEQIIDSSISLFNFLDKEFEKEETVVECKRLLLAHSLQLDNQ